MAHRRARSPGNPAELSVYPPAGKIIATHDDRALLIVYWRILQTNDERSGARQPHCNLCPLAFVVPITSSPLRVSLTRLDRAVALVGEC